MVRCLRIPTLALHPVATNELVCPSLANLILGLNRTVKGQ